MCTSAQNSRRKPCCVKNKRIYPEYVPNIRVSMPLTPSSFGVLICIQANKPNKSLGHKSRDEIPALGGGGSSHSRPTHVSFPPISDSQIVTSAGELCHVYVYMNGLTMYKLKIIPSCTYTRVYIHAHPHVW
jgi:hypothetical protein